MCIPASQALLRAGGYAKYFRRNFNQFPSIASKKLNLTGGKLASTQTQSPEVLSESRYLEWRNFRLEALPENRKVDWWHEAMVKENIWHQWFSDGIVKSETMISRSALAHIYENLKPKPKTGLRADRSSGPFKGLRARRSSGRCRGIRLGSRTFQGLRARWSSGRTKPEYIMACG
jgi:hypothetical protein